MNELCRWAEKGQAVLSANHQSKDERETRATMEQNIQSIRSKKKLLHNEALYVYEKLSKDGETKFWRCEFFGSREINCKGRIHTDLNDNVVRDKIGVHSCKTDATRVDVQRVITGVKRRACDTLEAPATIRSASLQSVATPVLASFPSVAATRLIVKRVRREINAPPPVPQDLTQLEIPFDYQRYTRTNEIFFHRFTSYSGDLAESIYRRMLGLLKQCWPTFSPESITMDFEQAMVNAVQAEFPLCTVRFCFFHLVRNLKKKIDDVHLTKRYRTEALFAQQARMITSLAFVPLNDLRNACAALEAHLPVELLPVFQWFLRNYIGQPRFDGTLTRPLFSPDCWSRPSIASCKAPLEEQKVTDVSLAKFEAGQDPPKRRKEDRVAGERILRLVQAYIPFDNAINNAPDHDYANPQNVDPYYNIIRFLSGISCNYLMDG
uniref:MULE transposase domain-containing protein n=1 Tax=Globodera rostochiensis TaxID=31243 RepID=A0A914H8B2_GLORO